MVEDIAEKALLGLGAASQMFPETLDEYYELVQDEMPFRIAL